MLFMSQLSLSFKSNKKPVFNKSFYKMKKYFIISVLVKNCKHSISGKSHYFENISIQCKVIVSVSLIENV